MRLSNLVLLLPLIVCACSTLPPREIHFEPTDYNQMPNWDKDSHGKAFKAFIASCEKIIGTDPNAPISKLSSIGGYALDWQAPCVQAMFMSDYNDRSAKDFFETWFTPYKVFDENNKNSGTLTGYYEIELNGSPKKTKRFIYPVYKRPKNLESLKSSRNFDHAAINNGALKGKKLELAWVDDRSRLFFMHIQGSGTIKMPGGKHLRVGFDGHNGYKFKGIADKLRAKGQGFDSTDEMMTWLSKHPTAAKNILESNPSYVFFKKITAPSAIGGQGVQLSPERSLAVDAWLYPYGTPIWVETKVPKSKVNKKDIEYTRLLIAQDTGGAIRGPIRGDIFFGHGRKAELAAGGLKVKGKFYALFPKTVKVPDRYTSE